MVMKAENSQDMQSAGQNLCYSFGPGPKNHDSQQYKFKYESESKDRRPVF